MTKRNHTTLNPVMTSITGLSPMAPKRNLLPSLVIVDKKKSQSFTIVNRYSSVREDPLETESTLEKL